MASYPAALLSNNFLKPRYQLEDDNLVTRRAAEQAAAEWMARHPGSNLKLDIADIGPL
jgi:hypothetical protein